MYILVQMFTITVMQVKLKCAFKVFLQCIISRVDERTKGDKQMMLVVIMILMLCWSVAIWITYHKLFKVYYFDLAGGLVKEIVWSAVGGYFMALLTAKLWYVAAIIVILIGLAAKNKIDNNVPLILAVVFAFILAITGISYKSFAANESKEFGNYHVVSVVDFDYYFDKKAEKVLKQYKKALENTSEWVYVDYSPQKKTSQTLGHSNYRYYGKIKNSYADGVGVVFRDNFPIYIGNFDKGYRTGYGIEFMTQADDYYNKLDIVKSEGEFKKGKYEGEHILYAYAYNDNTAYFGEVDCFLYTYNDDSAKEYPSMNYVASTYISSDITYSNGKENGKGKEYSVDKNYNVHLYYDGKYKNGSKTKGTLYFWGTNQKEYVGEFKNDEYHGKGTLYNEDGTVKYKGKFRRGDISA